MSCFVINTNQPAAARIKVDIVEVVPRRRRLRVRDPRVRLPVFNVVVFAALARRRRHRRFHEFRERRRSTESVVCLRAKLFRAAFRRPHHQVQTGLETPRSRDPFDECGRSRDWAGHGNQTASDKRVRKQRECGFARITKCARLARSDHGIAKHSSRVIRGDARRRQRSDALLETTLRVVRARARAECRRGRIIRERARG